MSFSINGDGFATEGEIADFLRKNKRTLKNWDKNPKLIALGWPPATMFNGRRHRSKSAVRAFVQNAAAAVTAKI